MDDEQHWLDELAAWVQLQRAEPVVKMGDRQRPEQLFMRPSPDNMLRAADINEMRDRILSDFERLLGMARRCRHEHS